MKNRSEQTINGITYLPVEFDGFKIGDTVCQMLDGGQSASTLGVVASFEFKETPVGNQRSCIILDNGMRMTRRGWRVKRLWKIA